MPDFGHPFAGMTANRKVTDAELARAIRFSIAAEYEAIQLYMQLAESTDNKLAQTVLKDIADEEIVHAGEFLRLLKELVPEEAALYAEGEAEVEEMMATLAGNPAMEPLGNSPEILMEPAAPEAEAANPGPEDNLPEETAKKPEALKAKQDDTKNQPPRGIGNLFENS